MGRGKGKGGRGRGGDNDGFAGFCCCILFAVVIGFVINGWIIAKQHSDYLVETTAMESLQKTLASSQSIAFHLGGGGKSGSSTVKMADDIQANFKDATCLPQNPPYKTCTFVTSITGPGNKESLKELRLVNGRKGKVRTRTHFFFFACIRNSHQPSFTFVSFSFLKTVYVGAGQSYRGRPKELRQMHRHGHYSSPS